MKSANLKNKFYTVKRCSQIKPQLKVEKEDGCEALWKPSFFKIYWIVLSKQNCQSYCIFFSVYFYAKTDVTFRNQETFIIFLFSIVKIWVLRVQIFFCSFRLIFVTWIRILRAAYFFGSWSRKPKSGSYALH